MKEEFIVICREDRRSPRRKGRYSLATGKVFPSEYSARIYARGISRSREPIVVAGLFRELRLPVEGWGS